METAGAYAQGAAQTGIRPLLRSTFFWQLSAVIVVGAGIRYWIGGQDDVTATVARWGLFAPLFIISLQSAMAATPFGTSLLPVLNGALFPLALAVLFNIVGGVAGATMMYFVWRRGESELRLRRRLDALPGRVRRLVRADLRSLILLRALPWAGGNLATLVAGTARVPLRIHVLSAAIGALPGSLVYALLGAGIVSL